MKTVKSSGQRVRNQDHTLRYYAYFNYLIATQRLVNQQYPTIDNLVQQITTLTGYQRIQGNSSANKGRVAELLHNSWLTWALLQNIGESQNSTFLNSPWSLVQSYYSMYSALQAYFIAQGQSIAPQHTAALKAIAFDLAGPQCRFPSPWNCTFTGNPNLDSINVCNAGVQEITLKNPLKSPYAISPWEHFGLFLKTTRQKMLSTRVEEWKKRHGRKKIFQHEKDDLINNLRPTTIFDAMYRVRTRSNYQDIDPFIFGVPRLGFANNDANKLHEAILDLTENTLLVLEVIIVRLLKKKWILQQLDIFATSIHIPKIQNTIMRHHEAINRNI